MFVIAAQCGAVHTGIPARAMKQSRSKARRAAQPADGYIAAMAQGVAPNA